MPRPRPRPSLLVCASLATAIPSVHGATIDVPLEQPTVQAGIDAAAPGDTVLVAPGTYFEAGLDLRKNVTLASHFLVTGDPATVDQTILDGSGSTILTIRDTSTEGAVIVGLTFRDGSDGISAFSRFTIEHCRLITCQDAIDYEQGSGGICRNNVFEWNTDDGIDCDGDVDIVIERNVIRDNEDDGIEIRLHDYSGPPIVYRIKHNEIYRNGEDGIQLIDYPGLTPRVFIIENNVFRDNAMAGIGCMADGNTRENYEAASIPEPIFLAYNVFDGHDHGITGGDEMFAIHNIVMNSTTIGIKNVDGGSLVSYTCFWQNGIDMIGSNVDLPSLVLDDPMLDFDDGLRPGSPCIDAGAPGCSDPDGSICDIALFPYVEPTSSAPEIAAAALLPNHPNPFSERTEIPFELALSGPVSLEVYDVRGRLVRRLLESAVHPAGVHRTSWDGATDAGVGVPSGFYFARLTAGSEHRVRRLVRLRTEGS